MAFYFYLSTKIIMVFITKSYQDLFGVRSYINAKYIPIPFELTRGKKNITLKIAARLKNMTGDIFDIRILPSNSEMDLK